MTEQMVFVGGLHRSGTTPLANVMAAHPMATGLTGTGVFENEGIHLQDVYPKIREYGGMGAFANDHRAHLTEASPLVSESNAQRLLDCWSPYWEAAKPVRVEKSPSNLIIGRFLQALFPGSALVVVVRHPVVVALANAKWDPAVINRSGRRHVGFFGHVAHWVRAHEILLEDTPHLRRLHVVRYEDLVDEPVGELAKIQQLVGLTEPYDASGLRPGRSERYAIEWEQMSHHLLKRRAAQRARRELGAAVRRFGYDLDDLAARAPWPS